MKMWIILIGLLLFGLISPFLANVGLSVLPLFTDPVSQIIIYLLPAGFILLWVFSKLFMEEKT